MQVHSVFINKVSCWFFKNWKTYYWRNGRNFEAFQSPNVQGTIAYTFPWNKASIWYYGKNGFLWWFVLTLEERLKSSPWYASRFWAYKNKDTLPYNPRSRNITNVKFTFTSFTSNLKGKKRKVTYDFFI